MQLTTQVPQPLEMLRRMYPLQGFEAAVERYTQGLLGAPSAGQCPHEERDRRARWHACRGLVQLARDTGMIYGTGYHREPAGRIRIDSPALQQCPRQIRRFIGPSPGHCFVDADLTSAHVAIAAARARDENLASCLRRGDLYEAVAQMLLIDRKLAKRLVIAVINGQGIRGCTSTLRPVLGTRAADAARSLYQWFWAEFPALGRFMDNLRAEYDAGGRVGTTLQGRRYVVQPPSWRGLASAAWSSVEADILDNAMTNLFRVMDQLGGGLVLPMYDGLLTEFPAATAEEGRRAVAAAMLAGGRAAGVEVSVEVPPPRTTWSGEEVPMR